MEFAEIQHCETPEELIVAAVQHDANGTLSADDAALVNAKLDLLYAVNEREVEIHKARSQGFIQ